MDNVNLHIESCRQRIKATLASGGKKPGNWWALEVEEKYQRGALVTMAAKSIAEKALGRTLDKPTRSVENVTVEF